MKIAASFKKNPVFAGMLLFTVLFYAFLVFNGALNKRESLPRELQTHGRMTSAEIQARETQFRQRMAEEPMMLSLFSLSLIFLGVGGLAANTYVYFRRKKGLPVLSGPAQADVPWGPGEVFKVFVILFFTEACFVLFQMIVIHFFKLAPAGQDFFLVINSFFRDVLVAGFVLYTVRRWGRSFDVIGLTLRNFWGNVRTGLVAYLAVIPYLLAILSVIAGFAKLFKYEPPPQAVVEIYMRAPESMNLVFLTIFVAVIGPIIEEIFFRGFAYKAFRSRFGVWTAMASSAAIFAVMHLNFIAFIPIFFLGAYLAYLYEKTGSLVPSMTVHMTHNLVMVIFTLFFKSFST